MEEQSTILQTHPNFALNNIPLDTTYRYQILTENYIDQVTELFTHSFCTAEPMTQYLQMEEKKYQAFARTVTETAVKDKLSIIALDKDRVIAIALVEDIALPGQIPEFDPKFIYILSLLDSLGHEFFAKKQFYSGNIAHLFITAVDENYRQRGLSKQVNFKIMDLAAQKGFDFIYCEFTNYYNELGIIPHLKNPKQLIGSCVYQNFMYENSKPFKNLAGGVNSYLWAIRENAKLNYVSLP